MKKLVLLLVFFTSILTSCSIDSEPVANFTLEVLPIDSVEVPDQFVQGETYEIFMTYTKPSSCYEFNDFIYEINGHERTIAIVNTVYLNLNCAQQIETVTVSFDFLVVGSETYLFKFYQGEDEQGVDQYHLVEVPVVSERNASSDRN
ncbi:MAG: hypothetical protein HKN40_08575 [Winogradskyella sp.]|uniref:hypothetical protein n=1 Tax=Winogradskyella sp. TaxID=1883156 RepID=UPI00180C1DFE|nr:hypothetical protein [Winogradskyella sp.]